MIIFTSKRKNIIYMLTLLLILLLIVTLSACGKKHEKKVKENLTPNTESKINLYINYNGKNTQKKLNKYSEIKDLIIEENNKHKSKDGYLGIYVQKINLVKNLSIFDDEEENIFKDLYAKNYHKKISTNKDITVFVKYKNKDYIYSYTFDNKIRLDKLIDRDEDIYSKIISEIPNQINGIDVKVLGKHLYTGRILKKNIQMPSSITNIEEGVFAAATTEGIKLSKNLKDIGEFAFSGLWTKQTFLGGVSGNEIVKRNGYWPSTSKKMLLKPYSIEIPESTMYVRGNAFLANHEIRSILFKGDKIKMLKGVYEMNELKSIKLPSLIEEMGNFSNFPKGIANFKMPYEIKKLTTEEYVGKDNLRESHGFMNNVGDIGENERFDITIDNKFLPLESFINNDSLRSVTVKTGVTELKGFTGKNIEEIRFEEGIEYIFAGSFSNSAKLTNITFPKSLRVIEKSAFGNNKNLTSITFQEGVVNVGNVDESIKRKDFKNSNLLYSKKSSLALPVDVFCGSKVSSIEFPQSLRRFEGLSDTKFLDKSIFKGNLDYLGGFNRSVLKSLQFNKNVKFITGFNHLDMVEEFKIPTGIEKAVNFLNSSVSIKKLDLTNGLVSIHNSFNQLPLLTTLISPLNNKIIDNSFSKALSLNNLTIGKEVIDIHRSFISTPNLHTVNLNPENKTFKYLNGVLFNDLEKILIRADSLENVPSDIHSINMSSIYGIPKVNKLIYPTQFKKGISLIDDKYKVGTFLHSLDWTKVNLEIHDNYKKDNYGDIYSVFALTVKNSEHVTEIDFNNFKGYFNSVSNRFNNLKTLTIPEYIIYDNILAQDKSVENIIFAEGTKFIMRSILSNKNSLSIKNITLPNSLERINDYSFANLVNIKKIKIPRSVTYLGKGVFIGWISSQEIYIDMKENEIPQGKYEDGVLTTGWATKPSVGVLNISTWDKDCKANIRYKI